jgi:hypothetical protein
MFLILLQLAVYLQGTSTASKLSQVTGVKKHTFFAPSNAAFTLLPMGDLELLARSTPEAKNYLNELMLPHTGTAKPIFFYFRLIDFHTELNFTMFAIRVDREILYHKNA